MTAHSYVRHDPLLAPDGLLLHAHVLSCRRALGRTFTLQCLGERVHDLIGPRMFTTAFAVAALLALFSGST